MRGAPIRQFGPRTARRGRPPRRHPCGEAGVAAVALLTGVAATAVAGLGGVLVLWSASAPVAGLVVAAVSAIVGTTTGVLTHRHIVARTHARLRERQALDRQLALLDGVVSVAGPATGLLPDGPLARIDAALREAGLLRHIAEGVHGVEALFDLHGRLIWISPSIERLTGRSPRECLQSGDALALLVHESDRKHCRRMVEEIAASGQAADFEMRLMHEDGRVCWVAAHWRQFSQNGEPSGLRMSAEDVQARKEAEYKLLETVAELRRSQALREHYLSRSNDERMRLTALLNTLRMGILFMDRDHRVLYYNRAMLEIWGFAPTENLIGVRDVVLQSRVAPLLVEPEVYFRSIQDFVRERHAGQCHEIRFKDGRIVTDTSAVVEGGPDGRGIGRVWIYEDVTEQRRIARQLVELAERDPLTDLYNRRRFHEELDRLLADAVRRSYDVGLILFDLDGFKPINDEFGHQAGDEVLVGMTRQVRSIVRRNETFCRLGGDEFAVLVPDTDESGLCELARRIVEGVASLRFTFDGRETGLTASIGIAMFPRHADDAAHLIAAADQAMYCSKSAGRNRWSIARCGGSDSARMAV